MKNIKVNTKKKSIKAPTILLSTIAVITIVASIVCGFLNIEEFTRITSITSIVVSGCSLMVAIGSLFITYKQEERNKKIISDEQKKKCLKFILDNEDDIKYLDFAQFYNNLRVFTKLERKIYNDYFLLENEVKEILHNEINVDKIEFNEEWLKTSYKTIESFCNQYKLGNLPFDNYDFFKNYIKSEKGKLKMLVKVQLKM